MVPYASAVETTSTIPSLGSAYVHSIGVHMSQGLIAISILSLAHYEVEALPCRADPPDLL